MIENRRFLKQMRLLLVMSCAIGMSAVSAKSNTPESAQDGLHRCGLINLTSARLACYDQLSGRQNLAADKTIKSAVLPPDELGSESLSSRYKKRAEPEAVNVRVIKCSKSGSKNSNNAKYIFHLKGGQVWKQISSKRLSFKECNFSASIRKDFFGYKMQLEDSNKKFRISRIR